MQTHRSLTLTWPDPDPDPDPDPLLFFNLFAFTHLNYAFNQSNFQVINPTGIKPDPVTGGKPAPPSDHSRPKFCSNFKPWTFCWSHLILRPFSVQGQGFFFTCFTCWLRKLPLFLRGLSWTHLQDFPDPGSGLCVSECDWDDFMLMLCEQVKITWVYLCLFHRFRRFLLQFDWTVETIIYCEFIEHVENVIINWIIMFDQSNDQ